MPRAKNRLPAYCHHKSDDQAVVYLNRKAHYLGRFNSPESHKRYGEIIAQLQGNSLPTQAAPSVRSSVPKSIGELCLKFAQEKLPSYSADEQHCQRGALRILKHLYAPTAAADFGPLKLRAVREAMIKLVWSRSFINKQVGRVKHLFRWAISWEYAPASVADALSTVEALKAGQSDAPDYRPRSAVPQEKLTAIRAELRGRYVDLFDLMLLTGARPGELIGLKVGDIDRSDTEVWKAELQKHKTACHGKRRVLFFAKAAQEILLRYMSANPDAKLFPIRRTTFGNAVKEACERALGMPTELKRPPKHLTTSELTEARKQAKAWRRANTISPHWLRHCVGTAITDAAGLESAKAVLGDSCSQMTALYSRLADKQAIEAVEKLG